VANASVVTAGRTTLPGNGTRTRTAKGTSRGTAVRSGRWCPATPYSRANATSPPRVTGYEARRPDRTARADSPAAVAGQSRASASGATPANAISAASAAASGARATASITAAAPSTATTAPSAAGPDATAGRPFTHPF
jgi:hypothetical protein